MKCLTTLVLAVIVSACSSPTIKDEPSAEFGAEGLHKVTSSGFEEAFARPGTRLANYRALHIQDMRVADVEVTQTAVPGTVRSSWEMTAEREKSLQQLWRDATDRAFADYQRAESGDQVLRLSAALTHVTPGRSSATTTTGGGRSGGTSMDTVDISAEFRLHDVASGDLLAVLRDRRTIASLQWSRSAGVDMVNLFNSWASLLHTRVSGR